MGCFGSKVFIADSHTPGQSKSDLALMMMLGFSQSDINVLYRAFCKIDVTGDNEIEFAELCAVLKLEDNEFTREIFAECDWNKGGTVNFCEFVFSLWYFLARDRGGLAEFAFEVYDQDDTGQLGGEEVETMVAGVYGVKTGGGSWAGTGHGHKGGKDKLQQHVSTVMKKLDFDGNGKISRKEFVQRAGKVPQLLSPAFDVQESLMAFTGGMKFWARFQKIREEKLRDPAVAKLFKRKYNKVSRKNAKGGKRNGQQLDRDADGKAKKAGHRVRK